MALGEITQKVLIDVRSNTRDATRGFGNLDRAIGAVSLDLEKMQAEARQTESLLRRLADQASGGMRNLGRAFGDSIGGINRMADALGPWNQALELGGKAIDFAKEGLAAYAKTSPQARAEVEKLEKEFSSLKQSVMAATGEMTVALLKPIPSIDELQKRTERLNNEWRSFIFTGRFGGGSDAVTGFNQMTDAVRQMFARDTWNTFSVEEALGKFKDGMNESRVATERARVEAARWRAEFAAMQANEPRNLAARSFAPDSVNTGISMGMLDQRAELNALIEQQRNLATGADRYAEFTGGRSQSMLEAVFGPIEEIDLYRQSLEAVGAVFNAFTDAVGAGYEALVTGAEPVGQAMKKAAAASMLAAGKASAIDAIREGALAAGQLAWGNVPSATLHAQSAALHAAVALTAGVAANALGSGGGGGGAGALPAGRGSSASGGGGSGGGNTTTVTNIIITGSDHADESPRMKQRNAQRLFALAEQKTSAGGAF